MKTDKKQTALTPQHPELSPIIFDKASLLDRLMNDEELAKKIIAGFLGDIPIRIHSLKDYLQRGDIVNAERLAHTIKGAAANIGGEALRAVALEIEMSGREKNLAAAQNNMELLETQFEQLREVIQKEI